LVFFGSCNGIFRALELKTGRVRWETKVSSDSAQYFFHGDPLISGNTIVVGADASAGGSVHAFDRATGQERWRRAAGRGVTGPIAGLNRRAYAAQSTEGLLVSLDIDSGEPRWTRPLKIPGFEGPAALGSRVFAGDVTGSLYALNAETGKEEWKVNLGAPVTTSITISASNVYVGTADGSVVRVDAERGAVLSSQKVDGTMKPAGVPVVVGDTILLLLTDKSADHRGLVSLDRDLTRVRWQVTAEKDWLTSRVFVRGDVVVLGTPSGEISAFCTDTGAKVWSGTIKGRVRSVGGAGNILLAGTQNGDLYALQVSPSCPK
jgi:outer membrane protein assembly factor BamB